MYTPRSPLHSEGAGNRSLRNTSSPTITASVFALSVARFLSRFGSDTLLGTVCLDLLIHEKPKLVFVGRGQKGNKGEVLQHESQMEKIRRSREIMGKAGMSPLSIGSSMGRAAGEVMLLLPSLGHPNLPGAQSSAPTSALQAHFPSPCEFLSPEKKRFVQS